MPETGVDASTSERIKTILRRDLKLGPHAVIEDDMPLVGGDFELDSLDMVMLVSSIEKEFGIKITDPQAGHEAFASVGALSKMLQAKLAEGAGSTQAGAPQTAAASGSAATADPAQMLANLPHQPPFRFVTRLTTITPMSRGSGAWEMTGEEAFFAGHFPGQPLVPGVLISEALAQLAGLVGTDPAGPHRPGRLAHIDVRFRQPVAPPATLMLHASLTQSVEALQHFDVRAEHDGTLVAEGQLTLARG